MAKLYYNIAKLHTFAGFSKKDGRHPDTSDFKTINDAVLLVERGRILWLGKKRDFSAKKFSIHKKIDLRGKEILPGFVECHTHSIFAGNRSKEFELRNSGVSYADIAKAGGGILSTVKATRKASELELLSTCQQRVKRFKQQGVTTLEIKSGYGLSSKDELKILKVARQIKGIRVVPTYLGPHALPKEYKNKSYEQYIDKVIKDLKKVKNLGLANRVDIFVEQGYFDISMARRYFVAAKDLGFSITVHAEQLTQTGATALAVSLGAKSVDHIVCITESDISLLAKSNTVGVMLPGADEYIHIPFPPARKIIDAGASFALATDFNPGSCPTQDLAYIGVLARLKMKMTLAEVLCAYTYGAAKALGLESSVGSLEVGKAADFICLEEKLEDLFYHIGHMPVTPASSFR